MTDRSDEAMAALRALRRRVEETSEHVGPRFAEEALKIHEGEAEARAIYGESGEEELERLDEEGVAYHRIPWVPKDDA